MTPSAVPTQSSRWYGNSGEEEVESKLGFHLSPEQDMLRQTAREFARKEVAPRAAHYDVTGEFPHAEVCSLLIRMEDVFVEICFETQLYTFRLKKRGSSV